MFNRTMLIASKVMVEDKAITERLNMTPHTACDRSEDERALLDAIEHWLRTRRAPDRAHSTTRTNIRTKWSSR